MYGDLRSSIHDRHIFVLNIEIKNIGVGSNAVWIDGFRNYRNTLLDCPAKTDLSRGMCILGSENTHYIIVKVSTSGKRCISLNLNSFRLAIFNQSFG